MKKLDDYFNDIFTNLIINQNCSSVKLLNLLHEKLRKYLLEYQGNLFLKKNKNLNFYSNSDIFSNIEKSLDGIINENSSRSCIIIGKPCSGKTKLLSSYFLKKEINNEFDDLILIHLNCLNYDDNTIFTILLERLNEIFPTHRKLFQGHQKISILKDKLLGISKCGYKIVFILENCESIIFGTSNISQLNLNIAGSSIRQFALYTLVDIMHSPDINLVLILTTSMFDLSDFFEKRVKSRMSQRRIIIEELFNKNKKKNDIKYYLNQISELIKIELLDKKDNDLKKSVDLYNQSIDNLFLYLSNDNKESKEILKKWEFLIECDVNMNDLQSIIAYQFLLITPQSSIKEIIKIFSICNFEKQIKLNEKNKHEFQSIIQGPKSFECMKLRIFADLSIIQHTLLISTIKLINLGCKLITFQKIMNEINILKHHITIQTNISGINFDHSEETYKMSFLILIEMGILEPILNIKNYYLYNSINTTPIKFILYKTYYNILEELNIPTVLQFWIKFDMLK